MAVVIDMIRRWLGMQRDGPVRVVQAQVEGVNSDLKERMNHLSSEADRSAARGRLSAMKSRQVRRNVETSHRNRLREMTDALRGRGEEGSP